MAFTISSNARSSSGTRVATTGSTSSTSPASMRLVLHAHDEPARDRLELGDVARPRIRREPLVRARRYSWPRAADLGRVVLDPALEQRRQVIDPIAQRRHFDPPRREQVVELARDDLRVDRTLDIDVGGRDHVDVVIAIADRAAQRALRRRRQIDHVLDEQRAARGGLERAARALADVGHLRGVGALERRPHRHEAMAATRPALVQIRATSSRPVPCSPVIRIGASPSANSATCAAIDRMARSPRPGNRRL